MPGKNKGALKVHSILKGGCFIAYKYEGGRQNYDWFRSLNFDAPLKICIISLEIKGGSFQHVNSVLVVALQLGASSFGIGPP